MFFRWPVPSLLAFFIVRPYLLCWLDTKQFIGRVTPWKLTFTHLKYLLSDAMLVLGMVRGFSQSTRYVQSTILRWKFCGDPLVSWKMTWHPAFQMVTFLWSPTFFRPKKTTSPTQPKGFFFPIKNKSTKRLVHQVEQPLSTIHVCHLQWARNFSQDFLSPNLLDHF